MKHLHLLFAAVLLLSCASHEKPSYTSFVNCFVGTDGPGNTYPGAVLPFGMVQLSPDNGIEGWDRIAGYYWQDSTIAGFSHKHLSGTGAGDLYDILVMPYNSRFSNNLLSDLDNLPATDEEEALWNGVDYRPYSLFSHAEEVASPGYYKVQLQSSGIVAELTTTQRVGMHRYTFPKDEASKILIDLGYRLNWDNAVDTYLKQEDEYTIVGYRYSKGWAPDQREHFVIKSSKPLVNCQLYTENTPVEGNAIKDVKTKCEMTFATPEGEEVMLKVALSSHSIEGARRNMAHELPHWDFDATVAAADSVWNEQLSAIAVEGSAYQKEVFYTNLYHCFLTPSLHSDVDGYYKGADGEYHQAVGYDKYETFSLWDTYRTAHPLYTILCPSRVEDFVHSFMGHYDETGLLPVWSFAGNETNMMIGYHAVPVIVDAYFKGIDMNAEAAYAACKATAMSDAWDLKSYKELGYVPTADEHRESWSVSKTLEYAYDDWCIAQMAQDLGKTEDYKLFMQRSKNWKHLYDTSSTFMRPKDKDGKFKAEFVAKAYTGDYCESNAWHYFWHLPHDITTLIDTLGQEAFVAKLDSMFSYQPASEDELPLFSTGMIGQYAHGNEPSHHVAYLYNQIGQPEKTQKLVKQIIETQYSNLPDGYCGNEDCGQMSAWLIMSSMGIYPVNPADGIYHLTTPWMKQMTVDLPNGKQLTIENNTANDIFTRVTLNGEVVENYTITHAQVLAGGVLRFE